MQKADSVDSYINKQEKYGTALKKIRAILLTTDLQEALKWEIPTYTINNKNVLSISAFKNHFGIWFFNGALLKDKQKVLVNAQEGKTKAMRQLRFTDSSNFNKALILDYVKEAIENQKKGLEIKHPKKPLIIPVELQAVFKKDKNLKKAFETHSLTNKREFSEYITQAKREETKQKRLEKIIPMILNNIGLNDKYKNC